MEQVTSIKQSPPMKGIRTIDLIGNTPLIEVTCFDTGICRLFLKLENQNPGGSIKDRIGLSMIEQAEREGKIVPGGTLVEATAGNTGLGLALAAITKGYKLILVIPDKMSTEKINHLRALGAEIVLTRSDVEKGHPEYYQDYAQRISESIEGAYYVNQFDNPANPLAHQLTTGPEIWEQTGQSVDAIVVAVGSSGTLKGLTDYFRHVKPDLEIVLADPYGSILADYVNKRPLPKPGSWFVEGIGEDFVPSQFDDSLITRAYTISDEESFHAARTLLRKEGILAGSSSGTLISAAVKYAREQKEPKNIVTFVCDSGNKYLTKMYNDFWMVDQGFIRKEAQGNLEDLITRKHSERSVITVKATDTLLNALAKMRMFEISQLPVVTDDTVVGIIDEWDILTAVEKGGETVLTSTLEIYMTNNVMAVTVDEKLSTVVALLKQGLLVIVNNRDGRFNGLITKMDYLNHLRKKLN